MGRPTAPKGGGFTASWINIGEDSHMAKGEFDNPSKPANDEYRKNWERIFSKKPKK